MLSISILYTYTLQRRHRCFILYTYSICYTSIYSLYTHDTLLYTPVAAVRKLEPAVIATATLYIYV